MVNTYYCLVLDKQITLFLLSFDRVIDDFLHTGRENNAKIESRYLVYF